MSSFFKSQIIALVLRLNETENEEVKVIIDYQHTYWSKNRQKIVLRLTGDYI